jgi:hypothetical protein
MEPLSETPNHTAPSWHSIEALHSRTYIREVLRGEAWAILSAERSTLDQRQNAVRTARLWADLAELGFEPIRVDGTYGGVSEVSYLVPGMTRTQALSLGRMYEQESILIPAGLLYCADQSLHPSTGLEWLAFGQNGPVSGDHSAVTLEDGSILAFAIVMDFNTTLQAA